MLLAGECGIIDDLLCYLQDNVVFGSDDLLSDLQENVVSVPSLPVSCG